METKQLPKVRIEELGMFLRTIKLDYKAKSNEEYAKLVTEFFDVLCTKEDVDNYEQLCILQEDFELESRKQSYFNKIGLPIPY